MCRIPSARERLLLFNLTFGLNFLKPVYFFQTSFFFLTSSRIELECRDGAVLRALASHQCGLEVPLNDLLQTESVDHGHDNAFKPRHCVSLSLGLSI